MTAKRFHITVNNSFELYFDGIPQPALSANKSFTLPDKYDLPDTTRIIAVRGIANGGTAGILASTTDESILSNSSWKCTNVLYPDWQSPDYDDSDWPAAVEQGANGVDPWCFKIPDISDKANWIWTSKYEEKLGDTPDDIIYCRFHLPMNLAIENSLLKEDLERAKIQKQELQNENTSLKKVLQDKDLNEKQKIQEMQSEIQKLQKEVESLKSLLKKDNPVYLERFIIAIQGAIISFLIFVTLV